MQTRQSYLWQVYDDDGDEISTRYSFQISLNEHVYVLQNLYWHLPYLCMLTNFE
jgi:hypothetical protein